MTAKNLLLELFVEELPPKALKKLGESFGQSLLASLRAQGLLSDASVLTTFASPRRLGAHVSGVLTQAADRAVQQKLMPVAVALDASGAATPALVKKLASLGLDASVLPQLRRAPDGKAEALFWDAVAPGVALAAGLQVALDEALAKLPIPKVMSYQLEASDDAAVQPGWTSVHFVRPAHGLVALHGDDVVPLRALGLVSGRSTRGHRFEAAVDPVVLQDADHYAQQLETQGAVIASFDKRRAEIQRQLQAAAGKLGLQPIQDDALLDEVTALVERPNVLTCQFESEFLAVPQECLILTMKANQKYFPLLDAEGKLTHHFLVVSNINPDDASAVIQGNERVVRPRLADAKFFFDQDRKKALHSRVAGLAKVVYHGKLGTQGERVERVRAIARALAPLLGVDAGAADRAALLAKADLLTDMVGEFPELQGIMGGYYARHDGEGDALAEAIEDHYKPRFAGDALPRNPVGTVVAVADKLETLSGLFGIGQLPTGDKDPFALRRHAIGVIRLLTQQGGQHLLADWVNLAADAFVAVPGFERSRAVDELLNFIYDRWAVVLRDEGYSAHEVDAVLSLRSSQVTKRLEAVRAFAALPEAASLAAANKRIGNILKKSDAAPASTVSEALLAEDAEKQLFKALNAVAPVADALGAKGEFTASLLELAVLKAPVDAFFDGVMVNAEDAALRANRLALLSALYQAMNRIAELSRLAV